MFYGLNSDDRSNIDDLFRMVDFLICQYVAKWCTRSHFEDNADIMEAITVTGFLSATFSGY